MKIIYQCELCGGVFHDENICHEHEKMHMAPDPGAKITPLFRFETSHYPDGLEVTMPDGSSHLYEYHHIIDLPLKPAYKKKAPEKEPSSAISF